MYHVSCHIVNCHSHETGGRRLETVIGATLFFSRYPGDLVISNFESNAVSSYVMISCHLEVLPKGMYILPHLKVTYVMSPY